MSKGVPIIGGLNYLTISTRIEPDSAGKRSYV